MLCTDDVLMLQQFRIFFFFAALLAQHVVFCQHLEVMSDDGQGNCCGGDQGFIHIL